MQVYACPQRRQSGSKSGGRESGRRNFRLQPKKFPIFHAKILTRPFLVVNSKNCLFSLKIFTFAPFTPTFLAKFSLYLIKRRKKTKRRFLTYFLYKIGYSAFRDPFTTPLRHALRPPTTPSPRSGGSRPPGL